MANTEGGTIVLGAVEDSEKNIVPIGIADPEHVLSNFWSAVNNKSKVSANVLLDKDAYIIKDQSISLVVINVSRVRRNLRPVYIGDNPMNGTFRRNFEGDYRCDLDTVKRMIAEATSDTRDGIILEKFTFDDIEVDSLEAYRNEFRATTPGHPWTQLDNIEFLRRLGALKLDRQQGYEGLTLAGILMFGKYRSIFDAVPDYFVDYQEQPVENTSIRWIDRVIADGAWSGNLYDFFRRVYPKLIAGLKIPFRLEQGRKRIDETEVHIALREAFVNCLVHPDYSGTTGILVVKQPHRFFFRNPGGLRLPLEDVLSGGISDCRNRELQKMFRMIGAGDQAGSGMPKILGAWQEQAWRKPLIRQVLEPEQTTLELTMQSLFPEDAMTELQALYGEEFNYLSEDERLASVTALTEEKVTNQRLQEITTTHRTDITKMLRGMVQRGLLVQAGIGPSTTYYLPSSTPPTPLFHEENAQQVTTTSEISELSTELEPTELEPTELEPTELEPTELPIRTTTSTELRIIELCSAPRQLSELAGILQGNKDYIRYRYVTPLVKQGRLILVGKRNSPTVQYLAASAVRNEAASKVERNIEQDDR